MPNTRSTKKGKSHQSFAPSKGKEKSLANPKAENSPRKKQKQVSIDSLTNVSEQEAKLELQLAKLRGKKKKLLASEEATVAQGEDEEATSKNDSSDEDYVFSKLLSDVSDDNGDEDDDTVEIGDDDDEGESQFIEVGTSITKKEPVSASASTSTSEPGTSEPGTSRASRASRASPKRKVEKKL
jgi:hypothetical protein